MREAAVPGYRLARAKRSTRVLISLAMLGVLSGLLGSALLTLQKTGLSASSVRDYYLGVPVEDALDGMLQASTGRPVMELAEVTHIHLLGGSMLLFLLCHLLAVCELRDETRVVAYSTAFISFIATFSSPWLMLYLSPAFSYLFGPAIITFIVSLICLTLLPLREMWWSEKVSAKHKSLEKVDASKNISQSRRAA